MMKPLVAVQCLVYNHSKYIRQCLSGLVMQRTTFPFVVVVHDDASSDGSVSIIKEFELNYPDIIKPFYETHNQYGKHDGSLGIIINNLTIKTGAKYFAICEGDDYWIDPMKLQKQVDFLENHADYSICGTNGLILYEGYFESPEYFLDLKDSRKIKNEELIHQWCFPSASIVCRISVIVKFPDWAYKLRNGDLTIIFMSMLYGKAYCLSDMTCVYRRLKGDSLQWQYWRNHIQEAQSLLIALFDHFIELYKDSEISHLLESEKQIRIKNFKEQKVTLFSFLNPFSWKRMALLMLKNKLKQTNYKKFHTRLDS